jgi:hypothetical protein
MSTRVARARARYACPESPPAEGEERDVSGLGTARAVDVRGGEGNLDELRDIDGIIELQSRDQHLYGKGIEWAYATRVMSNDRCFLCRGNLPDEEVGNS